LKENVGRSCAIGQDFFQKVHEAAVARARGIEAFHIRSYCRAIDCRIEGREDSAISEGHNPHLRVRGKHLLGFEIMDLAGGNRIGAILDKGKGDIDAIE
jgi:hypothetical protein